MKTDYIVEFLNLIDILNSFQAVKPLPFKYRVRGRYSVNECKYFITDGPFCIKSLAPDILVLDPGLSSGLQAIIGTYT